MQTSLPIALFELSVQWSEQLGCKHYRRYMCGKDKTLQGFGTNSAFAKFRALGKSSVGCYCTSYR